MHSKCLKTAQNRSTFWPPVSTHRREGNIEGEKYKGKRDYGSKILKKSATGLCTERQENVSTDLMLNTP